jgi:hypothetical protein
LAIIRWLWATSRSSCCSGSAEAPRSIFRRADASASGSWERAAPDASAWNSRLRLTAICTTPAAIGPSSISSRPPIALPPPRSSERPPNIDANIAMCARYVITVAMAPATELIRMSRL